MDILIRTADSPGCGDPPLIDAYAAVLALDRKYSDSYRDAGRRVLLDVADFSGTSPGDGFFTEKDIEAFLNAFETANGSKDYSRYDLNGDGKTGGTEKRPFNLDMDYPPPYFDTISQDIDFAHVDFNENELTDLDILCYYAYSPLYNGSDTKRKDLLRDRCAELTAELTFPSTIAERWQR